MMTKRTDISKILLLHEFVIMPDHFHALITPQTSLEKVVQFIKGGFSYRARKELGSSMEVWQKGFQDHRIRDLNDYGVHALYIHNNPVKGRFCERPDEFPYSSAHAGFELDAVPQGLKPQISGEPVAARLEGVPFQSRTSNQVEANSAAKGVPLQNATSSRDEINGTTRSVPFRSKTSSQVETNSAAKGAPLQNTTPADSLGASPRNKISNGTAEVPPDRSKAKTA
ncbi:MAG: transposase [Terriglobales bacterium]